MRRITYNENEWRLVPVVATREMRDAYNKACDHNDGGSKAWLIKKGYAPMLETAPEPRCPYCDNTGDVHSIDGEWRGECNECTPPHPTIEESLKVGEAVVDDTSTLEEWLKREMPPGTVINNPSWWAKRIARQAIYTRPQHDATDAERKIRALRNRLISERTNYHQAALDHPFEHARALAEADINE